MTNKDTIFQLIHEETEKNIAENRYDFERCTAVILSKSLFQDRTNVSRILNELFREGKLIKLSGRPVKFISKDSIQTHFPFSNIPTTIEKDKTLADYLRFQNQSTNESFAKSFHMVGANKNGSLYENINRIMSLFYLPGDILKIIILQGNPGTGKKYFLEEVHQRYAKLSMIPHPKDIHYFDIADFYLHMDAYIHEFKTNQETTFAIVSIDKELTELVLKKTIQRFEIEYIHAQQKPILAFLCTNDMETIPFLRYTPFYLKFSSIKDRPVIEFLDLVTLFIQNEAQRISRTIQMTKPFLEVLYENIMDIGQLKTTIIQLVSYALLQANKNANSNNILLDAQILNDFFQYTTRSHILDTLSLPDMFVITPNVPYDQIQLSSTPSIDIQSDRWKPTIVQKYYYDFMTYQGAIEYNDVKYNSALYAVRKILSKHLLAKQIPLMNYTAYQIIEILRTKEKEPTPIKMDYKKSLFTRISNALKNQGFSLSDKQSTRLLSILQCADQLSTNVNLPIIFISRYGYLIQQYKNILNLYFQKNIIQAFTLFPDHSQISIDDQIETIFDQVIEYDKGEGIILFTDKDYRSKIGNRFFIYSNTLTHCTEIDSFFMLFKTVDQVLKNNTNVLNITPNLLMEQNDAKKYLSQCDLNQYAERTDNPGLLIQNKVIPGINIFETNEIFYKLCKKVAKKQAIPLSNRFVLDFIFHCNCILFETKNNILLRENQDISMDKKMVETIKHIFLESEYLQAYPFSELDYQTIAQVVQSHQKSPHVS